MKHPHPPKKSKKTSTCSDCGKLLSVDDLAIDWHHFRLLCRDCKAKIPKHEEQEPPR